MELSRSTTRKVLLCMAFSMLLLACTGCNIADRLRPDLNLNGGLRTMLVDDKLDENGDSLGSDHTVQPGDTVAVIKPSNKVWSGGSPNKGDFNYTNPNRTQDIDSFAETTEDMLSATGYGAYLRDEVYEKLLEEIKKLDPEVQNKIYLRCGHTGYDKHPTKSKAMTNVSGWSDMTVGSAIQSTGTVGGLALMNFATDWVGSLDTNADSKQTQINSAQATINSYVTKDDMSKSWYQLSDSNLPAFYYKMMGRDGADFKTLQGYYDAIATDPYANIPNFNLYYYTGVNTSNKMLFNKVNSIRTEQYVPGVPLETVDKMFITYNQYIKRDRESLTNTVTDSSSLLKYHLDGYNKTLIYVGCPAGESLKSLVGESTYTKMLDIVSKAYMCTDVNAVKGISTEAGQPYKDITVMPAGSKGVD